MKLSSRSVIFFLLILFIVSMFNSHVVFSQEENYPRGAQYFLGTDDQLLIKVNVWGFVAKPGQYLVPSETDLLSLISFAGGPREGAKLSNIKLIRARKANDQTNKILRIDIDKFIKDGKNSLIPQLEPGDTIIVAGSTWYKINDFLGFVTKIAALVQIYWWIVYYSQLK